MQRTEDLRLEEHLSGKKNWKKWGPYLSERQWGTVREDYSPNGNAWDYLPHDHARSRAYRWGEDGIGGISDDYATLCFALALWNGKDPILKERLFGLTGSEGNHGEDVKELYYYLDSTPTHSYMKMLYKYPQEEFPYADLVHTNQHRSKQELEYEMIDTGVFKDNRYFDVFIEYAKAEEEDILIKITVANRGNEAAEIHLLPTLWYRNEWSFNKIDFKPKISLLEGKRDSEGVKAVHSTFGTHFLYVEQADRMLFTENETNKQRVFNIPNTTHFVKDVFHKALIEKDFELLAGKKEGTKFTPYVKKELSGNEEYIVKLRLSSKALSAPFEEFDGVFEMRIKEADEFYDKFVPKGGAKDLANIQRQAFAGMLWSKQFYYIDIPEWLDGDPGMPPPPESRKQGRNSNWRSLNNKDIISMPDKWEYPWYAAWDLAFHCIPLAMIDPEFAKNQLILIMREWYMAPNGQIPAYEWTFSDVNPPVHAWGAMCVYNIEKEVTGKGDIDFLKRVFQKLMLNFTWWVNRKDAQGKNIFEGGFLGLDNIGVFDRSNEVPGGGHLEQADGTSWMAMYSLNMMYMALEISTVDQSFEDVATKFFEHFVYISEALNRMSQDWTSAWDQEEGFFYDILVLPDDRYIPLKVRSLVGLSTLFAVEVLNPELCEKVPNFLHRLNWFVKYRAEKENYCVIEEQQKEGHILLSLVDREKLIKLLHAMLDETEFLSPGGIRSVSKVHKDGYSVNIDGQEFGMRYAPGESDTNLFGGNSNWRGPVWMPMNYLLINSLKKYASYYEDNLKIEYPTGSGKLVSLAQVADELSRRLISIFQLDKDGNRPVNDKNPFYRDPHFRNLILFYEYFHGDTARGVGASHQTGWTGLVADLIDKSGWK